MSFKNIVDIHNHTIHSFDGHYSVDDMCEAAIAKGIRTIALTDHIEMDFFREQNFDKTADESFDDIKRAKEKYKDKIEVLVGVEMGQPTFNVEESIALMNNKDYDVVIGSIHNPRNKLDFYYYDYSKDVDVDELLKEYFDELKIMASWAKFDTLGHITYPLRYIVGEYGINVDLSKYQKDIDEFLSLLAENDKPIEINTSGLRQKIGVTMPNEPFIKRFKELGGKYVTLGSDAHYTEHIGMGIDEGMKLAKECGFDSALIFRHRQPVEIPIE